MEKVSINISVLSVEDGGKKVSWRGFLWENENKGTVYGDSVEVGPDADVDEAMQLLLHQAALTMAAAIESKKEEKDNA